MADLSREPEARGLEITSPASHASGATSTRRRRAASHGNPEKIPCNNCGRVPHRKYATPPQFDACQNAESIAFRGLVKQDVAHVCICRCEHHLCPRCCNVVVKNCPVHIRKSDLKRGRSRHAVPSSREVTVLGAHGVAPEDAPRNLTEAVEVYHNEMESVRHQYRWMYERKRMADEEELKQSIKRYKENTSWLSELMTQDLPSKIAEQNEEMGMVAEKKRKAVREQIGTLVTRTAKALKKHETRQESRSENGRCHKNGEHREVSPPVKSASLFVTPVSLPESEWLYILQRTAEKPSIQLRPT